MVARTHKAPKRAPSKAPKGAPPKAPPKATRAAPKAKSAATKKAATKAKAPPKPRRAPAKFKAAPAKQPRSKKPVKPIGKASPRPPAQTRLPTDPVSRVHEEAPALSPRGRSRSMTARQWAARSSPVVEILDDKYPIGALRRFLDSIKGTASEQQAQIALGAAQLMLLPIARESRGGNEVKELVDLMLERWSDFGERRKGFHAREFLRNAFAAIGVDRERIAKLSAVVPANAGSELLFNIACAHAVARDKVAMLHAVEAAIEAGASAIEFRRDNDFAPYANDHELAAVLARAEIPVIPVDIEPHLRGVRRALDELVAALAEYGEHVELRPPVRLDAILDAERAHKISLPNDYRALLTITNGMKLWGHEFLGVGDYRENTPLALRAQHYLNADHAAAGLAECVPIACWGQPNDWLLYDPRGRVRGDEPGYVIMLNADEKPMDDLPAALAWLESIARDVLGTN
jgi:hypothetical protein